MEESIKLNVLPEAVGQSLEEADIITTPEGKKYLQLVFGKGTTYAINLGPEYNDAIPPQVQA